MSNRKLSLQGFFHQLGRLYRKITKSFVTRVLRYVLFYQRRGKLSTAGFILPTTVLLILVVALTVGALTFRAYNRNVQVIGDAQQRVIYNAATPAIDRARSKLEFLFDSTKDTRLPSGVPSQATLEAMLLNNGTTRNQGETFPILPYKDANGNQTDAYTFPDETRIDINNDSKVDNAWYFRTDTNGDGRIDTNDSTVVYSIISNAPRSTPAEQNAPAKTIATRLLELNDAQKAQENWVRQAPLSVDGALGCARNTGGGNAGPDGWFEDKTSSAILRKNFQVDALVIPGNAGGTKATLEFTQDRQIDRGNKWGAWFRHDLEIYPGAPMNWNGAMHTEGSLIVGSLEPQPRGGGTLFTAYLISSPESCLFTPSASEITVTDRKGNTPTTNLQGLVAAGVVGRGSIDPQRDLGTIHLHSNNPTTNAPRVSNTTGSSAAANPIAITSDAETVMLENGYTTIPTINNQANPDRNNRGANLTTNASRRALSAFGADQRLPQRISANPASAPYVDDLYRADDLWGPKPKYKDKESATVPEGQFGKPIPPENSELINNSVLPDDSEASGVGLDGYWERRARVKGLRLLVGQRLELGNLFTWYAPRNLNADDYVANDTTDVNQIDQPNYEHEGDPLYPVTVKPYPVTPSGRVSHVDLQRRTLRDNLSAVQSTAIYHAAANVDQDYPIACLATTSHPGTLWTLRQALTFRPFSFSGIESSGTVTSTSLLTNFFTGVGTNGWEFAPPGGDYSGFISQVQSSTSSLRKALQNLANFAGDHQTVGGALKSGAFPPTPNDNVIHPYPALSMWGNYSNLKRALKNLSDQGNDFSKLSIADKTYIQTAACTIGMLAYNVNEIQKFDPSAVSGTNVPNDKDLGNAGGIRARLMAKLGRDLWLLMDGTNDGPLSPNPEVLHREQMATYGYSQSTNRATGSLYNAADYESVPPEAFIAALRQYLLNRGTAVDGTALKPDSPEFIEEMRLAETIMLHHQIRRDRTFGFKPSPRFGRYRVLPAGRNDGDFVEMAAACDPDQFVFANTDGDRVLSDRMQQASNSSFDPRLLLPRTSTLLNSTGLTAVSPVDSTGFPRFGYGTSYNGRDLSQYRLALSRLCGTLDASGTQVLPKFPALYYLFPEARHNYNGGDPATTGYDDRQPANEPYIADNYVSSINASFEPISETLAPGRAGYRSPSLPMPTDNLLSRRPDPVSIFPVPDLSVSAIALTPQPLNAWRLPTTSIVPNNNSLADFEANKANFTPNLILQVDSLRGSLSTTGVLRSGLTSVAVPFLDRAFFDGRQLMLTRTLDIDLGMLRGKELENARVRDVWLPASGIVYAFREDAVREDAISRPTCGATVCEMNLQDPAAPIDPKVRPVNSTRTSLNPGENGISTKAIDRYPDPDRRIYGFRLRNGAQLKRDRSLEGRAINAADNIKGLSFFTDQPVYIQGDYNLHQDGADNTTGNPLEEFLDPLADNYSNFYTRRRLNNDFAKPDRDRWRPSEILADSISVLSNGFCDGSIADTFLQYTNNRSNTTLVDSYTNSATRYPVPDARMLLSPSTSAGQSRSYYHEPRIGLFDPGCLSANHTSFHNQNRPAQAMVGKVPGLRNSGWDWVRENSRYDAVASRRTNNGNGQDPTGQWVDITAPVKISRSGHPLVVRPRDVNSGDRDLPGKVLPPVPYNVVFQEQTYYNYGEDVEGGRNFYANYSSNGRGDRKSELIPAVESRVNSIVVSGITPSRPNQGYGGLHNFPRFLETWEGKNLRFSGSFIQLSYANYATAPFELENLEPWTDTSKVPSDPLKANSESVYYKAPNRLWGYDVGLQYSPAGPAAARFVTASKNRSEYYVEPPANDPYIANLCEAAKARPELNLNTSCPRRGGN